MAANALTYIKNVGKSVAYVSFKVAKDMNPVLTEYGQNNAELAKTIYRTTRNLKRNIAKMPEIFMESEYGKFGQSYIANLIDDAKTGKFYNKEREDQYEERAAISFAGLDGEDIGGGFEDLDNLDFNDSESDDEFSSNEMMDMVGEKASSAVSTAVAKSAEYITESNVQVAKARTKQINVLYTGMLSGMTTINQNLAKVIEFSNEQSMTHYENSRTYFETNTRLNEERNNMLKTMNESLTKLVETPKSAESKRDKYSSITDYDGIVNFEEYFKAVKDNIIDSTGGLYDMLKTLTDTTGLQNLVASPLSFVVENMVKSVIPKALEESMTQFNKTIGSLFGNVMMKLSEKAEDSGGGLWETIANIFGIQPYKRTSVDLSMYEKGRVPFDGITRKAIVEVIPTYLSKILSAITGRKEDRFNYESGRFVTVDDMKKTIKQMKKDDAKSAAFDLDVIVRGNKNKLDLSEEQSKQFDIDWQGIYQWMYENQRSLNTNDKTLKGEDFNLNGGAASDLNVKLIQYIIDTYGRTENAGYAHKMYRTISNSNQAIDKLQQSNSINAVFNGSAPTEEERESGGIKYLIDSANNEIISELRAIRKEVAYIRTYGLPGSRGANNQSKKNRRRTPITDFNSFTVESVYNSSGPNIEYEQDDTYAAPAYYASDLGNIDELAANIITQGNINEEQRKKDEEANNSFDNESPKEKKKRKTIFDRIRSFKKGTRELVGVPLNFMSAIITKVDNRLYDLIFRTKTKSDDDEEEKGFLERMMDKVDEIFEDFSGYLQEHVLDPLSNKINDLFSKFTKENILNAIRKIFKMFDSDFDKVAESVNNFFGDPKGAISDFWNDYKQSLKEMFGFAKKSVKETANWAGLNMSPVLTEEGKKKQEHNEEVKKTAAEIFNNAANNLLGTNKDEKTPEERKKEKEKTAGEKFVDGVVPLASGIKRVNKTGLAVISEGEMIIPPDMNPFNLAKRKRNENKVKEDLKKGIDSIYEYAEGKEANSFKKLTEEQRAEIIELEKARKQYEKDNIQELTDADYIEKSYPMKIAETAADAASAVIDNLKDIVGDKKDHEKFKKNALSFMGDVKEYGATLAAGATVGAGVSLITGLFGGPLVGAAVGAATGLLSKSETFQNMIFGEIGEDGERAGGLISKDITKNIKKYFPDMSKGATVGAIASILPFFPSPLVGILIGSAVGFAKNNQTVQEMLFGPDKLLGEKKDFQDKVRKLAPKIGLGAIAGLLAGPFGSPVMNVIMGSALGFASDTNAFKDLVFGEKDENGKRKGGFMGKIRTFLEDDILEPLKRAKDPIIQQFKIMGEGITGLFKNIFESITEHIKDTINTHIGEPLKEFASKAFDIISKPFRWATSLPFKAIGYVGDILRTSQIKSGRANYMSAEERNLYRKSKGVGPGLTRFMFGDKYKNIDESLAGIKSTGDLEQISNIMDVLSNKDKAIKDVDKTSAANIRDKFNELKVDPRIRTHALKLVRAGRTDEAAEFIQGSKIPEENKKEILKVVSKEAARMRMTKQMRENSKETTKNLIDEMKKLGFDVTEDQLKDSKTIAKLVSGQLDYRKKFMADETTEENKSGDASTVTSQAVEDLDKNQSERHEEMIKKVDEHQQILDEIKKYLSEMNEKLDVDSKVYDDSRNREERRLKALSGISDNPEDEDLKFDSSLGQGTKGERIKDTLGQIWDTDPGDGIMNKAGSVISKTKDTIKTIPKISKIATEMNTKDYLFARDVVNKAKEGLGKGYRAVKSKIGSAYSNFRNNPLTNKILGKKDAWHYGIMSEGEVVLPGQADEVIENIKTHAEGQVPGQKDASSLYDIWKGILSGIRRIAAVTSASAYSEGIDVSKINDNGSINDFLDKVKSKFGGNGNKITQFVDGLPIKMIRDKNGNLIPDPSNSDNDNNFKAINEEKNTQKGILASLMSMPSSIGNFLKEFNEEGEEKEPSLLSKIFGFAKNGVSNIKNLLSSALGLLIQNAIPLGIAAFFLNENFRNAVKTLGGIIAENINNILYKLSNGAFGKDGANDKTYSTDENGNPVEVKQDENGNPVKDEEGNYVTTDGESIDSKFLEKKGSYMNMSFLDRIKYNTVRGTVLGTGSIIGGLAKITKTGRLATKAASAIGNKIKVNVGLDTANMNQLYDMIVDAITKWKGAMKGVPVLGRFADKLDNLGMAILEVLENNLAKSPKSIASATKSFSKFIALPLIVASAVIDFTTGMQDASTILKIRKDAVTLPQKIVCGLLRTIKNFIPFIGTFIPEQIITDLFIKHVAEWFGMDVSELKKERDIAKQELDAFNEANNTDLSWTEYNKQIQGNYTWTEKITNTVKSGWATFKGWMGNKKPTTRATAASTSMQAVTSNIPQVAGSGSGIGSGTFVSQLDPQYKDKQFNIPGDTKIQTLGDTGCAPAAAAMAINMSGSDNGVSMESAATDALKFKVNNDGVTADYFSSEFAKHGLQAEYLEASGREESIINELRKNKKVILMGEDKSNTDKRISPFGINPHYVVATGISKDGKHIFINDPEASTPNIKYSTDKVLNNISLGVTTKSAGSGTRKLANKLKKYIGRATYGKDTTQYKVWNALKKAGYNDIAVAAAMGNIQHESGFDPSIIEHGNGIGFGLIQWSYGRRTAMENYAKNKGVDPSDLSIQIEYLLLELQPDSGQWTKASSKYNLGEFSRKDWAEATNLANATKAFMCCFERPSYDPSVNGIAKRLEYAAQYYEAFTGVKADMSMELNYSKFYNGDQTGTSMAGTNYSGTTSTGSSGGILGQLSTIFSSLTNAFGLGNLFGGSNQSQSYSSDGVYTTGEPGTVPNSTVDDPVVPKNGFSGNTSSNPEHAALQRQLVEKMYSKYKTLKYGQGNEKYPFTRNVDKGGGDCSSTVKWAYKNVLGVDPGDTTDLQRVSDQTYTVATSTADESKLQLGDLLLRNGHVEMYAGNGKMIGHGGGNHGEQPGPTEKDLDRSGKYNLVRRWIGFKPGSGSGISPSYGKAYKYVGSGSEVKPSNLSAITLDTSDLAESKSNVIEFNSNKASNSSNKKKVGRATDIPTTPAKPETSTKEAQILSILQQMATLLIKVVTNTDTLNKIVELLTEIINGGQATPATATAEAADNVKDSTVLAKQNLINAIQGSGANSNSQINAQLMKLIEDAERIARQ